MKKYLSLMFFVSLVFFGSVGILNAQNKPQILPSSNEEKEFVGNLSEASPNNIQMWGTHKISINSKDEGCTKELCGEINSLKVYPVRAENDSIFAVLKKYENNKVKILGTLDFYDLEGGFWGVTAKEVRVLSSSCPQTKEAICQSGLEGKFYVDEKGCKSFRCLPLEKGTTCPSGCSCEGKVNICPSKNTPTITVDVNGKSGTTAPAGQTVGSDIPNHRISMSKDTKGIVSIKEQAPNSFKNTTTGVSEDLIEKGNVKKEDTKLVPTIVSADDFEVTTKEKVSVINNKLSMKNYSGEEKLIEVMPKEIPKILEVSSVQKAELIQESEKPVYKVEGNKEGKILWVFNKNMEIKATIDAESGSVVSVKKPWWSFLFK